MTQHGPSPATALSSMTPLLVAPSRLGRSALAKVADEGNAKGFEKGDEKDNEFYPPCGLRLGAVPTAPQSRSACI